MLRDRMGARRLAPGLVTMTWLAISVGAARAAEPAPAEPVSTKPAEKSTAEKPPAGKSGTPGEPAGEKASASPAETRAASSGGPAATRGAEGDKSPGAAGPEGAASTPPGREKVKRAASAHKKNAGATTGDEAPALSTPPLDIGGLRAEVRREAPPAVGIDPPELPETRVEKMLADVAKARESLHDDTRKLEALLAAENGGGAEGEPAAAGGKPGTKSPLDILAKALRGIKPDQAAPIVSRLDRHLGAVVLQRMPPADAGKILGAMKPEIAAELATLIALHRPVADARGGEAKR